MSSTSESSLPLGKTVETDLNRLVGRRFSTGKKDVVHLQKESWIPWLSFIDTWNSVNAYNCALFSNLVYQNQPIVKKGVGYDWGKLESDTEEASDIFDFFNDLKEKTSRTVSTENDDTKLLTRSVPEAERIRLDDLRFWKKPETDTQALAASSANRVLFSVRGTQNWRDWIQNVDFEGVPFEAGPDPQYTPNGDPLHVHDGFHQAFQSIKGPVDLYLNQNLEAEDGADKTVFVCGHSLGGAVGLLLAAYIRTHYTNRVVLNTYGMPRAVERPFAKHYSLQGPEPLYHHRHVHHRDPVPHVPIPGTEGDLRVALALALASPTTWPGTVGPYLADYDGEPFAHHGRLVYLPPKKEKGSLPHPGVAPNEVPALRDIFRALWNADDLGGAIQHQRSDHYLSSYVEILRRRLDLEISQYLEARGDSGDGPAQAASKQSQKYHKLTETVHARRAELEELYEQRAAAAERDPQRRQKIKRLQAELWDAHTDRASLTPPGQPALQNFLLQTPSEQMPESPVRTLRRFQEGETGA